jgi:polar amino acid transport system ATP-binding protein/sulfate transport system ATP-binding protein
MIPGASVGEPVLRVRNVRVSRGSARVLDGVTFDVPDRVREGRITGQVVSILGPSGVGKTTLLRVLRGLERLERGEVSGPEGVTLDTRTAGVVFQDYPLLTHRTVEGNLLVAGRIGGLDERRAKARTRELLERLGLEDRRDHYPAQLSGGQRQRVAIAQQLVLPRRVLLLDEPFSGLDPAAVADVLTLVTEVANEHEMNTIVIVTHDVRAALRASDTVVLLGRGEKGARVDRIFDLVELGIAWEHADEATGEVVRLEREIERRFKNVS